MVPLFQVVPQDGQALRDALAVLLPSSWQRAACSERGRQITGGKGSSSSWRKGMAL